MFSEASGYISGGLEFARKNEPQHDTFLCGQAAFEVDDLEAVTERLSFLRLLCSEAVSLSFRRCSTFIWGLFGRSLRQVPRSDA